MDKQELDLKVGDTVELRNGRLATVISTDHSENENFPIYLDYGNGINYFNYTKKGLFHSHRESKLDIIKKVN